ncbi:MAG: acylphosphatase [Aggregatilineales bacterium]
MSALYGKLHAVVHGWVQGVSFRAYAVERARRLRLTGWVRNRPDGAVETVAVGPRHALDSYVDWLHRGPPNAEVKQVDATITDAADPDEMFTSFEVRYGD